MKMAHVQWQALGVHVLGVAPVHLNSNAIAVLEVL